MRISTWLVAGILLAPAAVSAAEFEGRVNFKMTAARGQSQEIQYAIKGGRLRIEVPGQPATGGMIMDPAKKEMIMVMDEQRMYLVMPIPDPAAAPGQPAAADVKLERTGQKEKILGHVAEKYVSTYEGVRTELWLAEGLGTFVGFNAGGPGRGGRRSGAAPAAQAWERALAGKDLFPLRVVTFDTAGRESFRMEATLVERQSLPDTLFTPPAGYQKMDMGGMMRGLMPGSR
jgi:hypothetical protein